MAQKRQVIFRIFYSTSFTAVFLILTIVIAVTPADTIYESYKRRRLIDIFLIAGDYVVTALLAVLIYASRLYTNRSVLKDIPKTYMPIEKEDLPGKRVHKLIQECLEKSAVIAYQARPRSRRIEHDTINIGTRMLALTNTHTNTDPNAEPSWGKVAHPGWSSPASKELPGLEYCTVVDELIDLIEAKAVSLAPINPHIEPGPDGAPMPDPRVIDQLARSGNKGMRAYLQYLIDIGVVPDNSLVVAFLAAYERARFSSEPLSDEDFDSLMRMFAELLRNMSPVDVEMLDLEDDSDHSYQSETSSLIHRNPSHRSRQPDAETSSIPSTYSASGSVRHHKLPPRRISEDSAPSLASFEQVHHSLEKHASSEPDIAADGHHFSGMEDIDTQSSYLVPTSNPRRPGPSTTGSSSRMFSAVSRISSHSDNISRLSGSGESDTGSVVHHDLARQSTRSSRRSGRSGTGVPVIRLAREGEDGNDGMNNGLPYRIEIPNTER
ncbi:uncharacterized protein Z520_08060 [Fonsecaea multimorphosa CBS 102226]|uniref:Defect at low temperature protein 1 n=1 Tax=Fonsecaea multimorphosa CBS 102226 TaxID=1442371 RepID=A0A0D2JS49_9EURO|nr:uncharacterized protein Z520_08060 [Fonsecaea multimorphosa CBS 102226]KIX96282.1 hypothetical protein Z520_08060 [Fonsecaea multimorphosa CBS 102226]OAL21944.1 hypothetical protein AYO22_07541 [Fonsecaea multimorphosa]